MKARISLLTEKIPFPFQSYDTRGSHAGTPSHWKDEEILENRAIFRTIRTPAELVIKPVKVSSLFYREVILRGCLLIYFCDFLCRKKTLAIFAVALTSNYHPQGIAM